MKKYNLFFKKPSKRKLKGLIVVETGDEMRSQDENSSQGTTKLVVFSLKLVLMGFSTPVFLDLPYPCALIAAHILC
jgi:hypothetical protein